MVKSQADSSHYSSFCISDGYNGLVKGEECFAIFVLKFSVVRNGGGKMESYGYKKRREHQVLPLFYN